jgi:hypothetical protein
MCRPVSTPQYHKERKMDFSSSGSPKIWMFLTDDDDNRLLINLDQVTGFWERPEGVYVILSDLSEDWICVKEGIDQITNFMQGTLDYQRVEEPHD